MDGAVDVGQLYVQCTQPWLCAEGERKRGKKEGGGDREAKRGKGGAHGKGEMGGDGTRCVGIAFFNLSFSALKATEDSIPWHPLLPEGSTTLKEQF